MYQSFTWKTSKKRAEDNRIPPADICFTDDFNLRANVTHCPIWADVDHLCGHIQISFRGRISGPDPLPKPQETVQIKGQTLRERPL